MNLRNFVAGFCLFYIQGLLSERPPEPYYGTLIGRLKDYAHGITGTVYAVDESTIFIKGFSYDGTGPDAFFWIGNSPRPSPEGIIIPYPEDFVGRDPPVLKAFKNADVILRLPLGKKIKDIRWLSVWCRRFTVDFGEVFIPPNLDVPKPRTLHEFKRLAHGLRSENITILDAKTFYIPNLHYDGAGPDAYFWVGNGTEPTPFGIKVPNEVGSLKPLRGYQGEDIEIQLPDPLTVYDIDWFSMWCVRYKENFGHVLIPKDLHVPPALGQTKISTSTSMPNNPSNCKEFLDKKLQVRWQIQDDMVVITLSGRIKEDQWMAFGLSGAQNGPRMKGGDVTVAFYDSTSGEFNAVDYYMSHESQCDGKSGVCPDERIGGKNDVTVIAGNRTNGITRITYTRPLQTNEAINDKAIPRSGEVSVIAAFGPLNARKEANAHSMTGKTMQDYRIDFSSMDDFECSADFENYVDPEAPAPWPPVKILGETTFTARIGPTGGKRGYTPITGHPSWGICWYINDQLIPELYLERGQTYTFTVEGGDDETNPARYHPFYITDSKEGGFGQKTFREQKKQRVYAGVAYDKEGYPYPTAAGRYCEWTHNSIDMSSESESFAKFMETLRLQCEPGEPAVLNFTVPLDAPNLLYYQCYTHSNLGWKINIVDPGYIEKQNSSSLGNVLSVSSISVLLTLLILMLTNRRNV